MDEFLQAISNYGVGVVCVAYIIYFQNTTMKEMLATLQSINNRMIKIETKIGINERDD